MVLETSALRVEVFLEEGCPRLEWFDRRGGEGGEAFLRDSRTRAYAFDKGTGGVMHYVRRSSFWELKRWLTMCRSSARTTYP